MTLGHRNPSQAFLINSTNRNWARRIGRGIDNLSNTSLHEKEVAFGPNCFGKDYVLLYSATQAS